MNFKFRPTQLISPRAPPVSQGHVINISSIAGKQAYPNGAFYCASKHAVEADTHKRDVKRWLRAEVSQRKHAAERHGLLQRDD